jgi:hypothetical protein
MFRVSGRRSLITYFGKEAGRFDGEEIHGSNGRYVGAVMIDNRLISSRSKKDWAQGSFKFSSQSITAHHFRSYNAKRTQTELAVVSPEPPGVAAR